MIMTNAAFCADPEFIAACNKASEVFGIAVGPTAAQASKYRRGFGAAYNAKWDQPLGCRISQRPGTPDEQRSASKPGKINDYGPYSATPRNNKPAAHPGVAKSRTAPAAPTTEKS